MGRYNRLREKKLSDLELSASGKRGDPRTRSGHA